MKKDLGVKPYLFPMPVLMVATYNEDGSVRLSMIRRRAGITPSEKRPARPGKREKRF